MRERYLFLVLAAAISTPGILRADIVISGPTLPTDPHDIVSIDDLLESPATVTLGGDKVGSISNVVTAGEVLTFNYTLPSGLIFTPTATFFKRLIDPPNDVNHGSLSDLFLVSLTSNSPTARIQWASDPGTLSIPAGAIDLGDALETGDFQNMVTFSGSGMTLDFNARSDVEATPEPKAAGILLALLLGIGVAIKKSRSAY